MQARKLPLLQVLIVSQGLALAVLLAVTAIATLAGHRPPELTRLLPAAAGGLAGVVGLAAFYRALAMGTMSIVAPIAATGVCIPVIVGIADGEHPAPVQLIGILAAIAGVVLVSTEPDPHPETRRTARVSIALALVAAIGFGSLAVGLRSSARADVLWALVAARSTGVIVIVAAFAITRPTIAGVRSSLIVLGSMGMLDLLANALYALALTQGLLSVVAVGASLYPVATVMLARALLGERVRRSQEIGIAATVAGIAMIAAG